MDNKLDMTFDEIIELSEPSCSVGSGQRGRGGPRFQQLAGRLSRGGAGGSAPIWSRIGGVPRAAPYSRGDIKSRLQHDMFDGSAASGNVGGSRGISGNTGDPAILLVSNLDFGVTDSDVQAVFSKFKVFKSAAVHYDRSGQSLGLADVVFNGKSEALKAMKQYNGFLLKGRAMNIKLVTSEIPSVWSPVVGGSGGGGFGQSSPQLMGGRGRPADGRRGSGGGIGRMGQGGGSHGMKPTFEELNVELDAYMKQS